MAEVSDESLAITGEGTPIDQTKVKTRGGRGSSDSSDDEKSHVAAEVEATKAQTRRLFGRKKSVHEVFGGGKPADLVLWRNKKVSGAVVGGATVIWVLFELVRYHLLPLVCHCLILALAAAFVWSRIMSLINKSPPEVPEVHIREDLAVNVAMLLRSEINRGLAVLRDIASGRNLKKFLVVISGLWVLSRFGNCCNFLTLFYIVFVILHTVPVLYEKYDDKVDAFAEKAVVELKRQYTVVDAKLLSKIPRGPLKDKKL